MPNEEVKKQNINKALETACGCFLEHGIEMVTMEMISRESGISRASLGRYFSGKKDLVFQTITWIGRTYREGLEKRGLLKKGNGLNGLQRLRLFMEYTKLLYLEDPRAFILRAEFKIFVYRNIENGAAEGERLIEDLEFRSVLRKIYAEGIADGSMVEGIDIEQETKFFCEAYFGFFADSASSGQEDRKYVSDKIDRYIKRVLNSYKRV